MPKPLVRIDLVLWVVAVILMLFTIGLCVAYVVVQRANGAESIGDSAQVQQMQHF